MGDRLIWMAYPSILAVGSLLGILVYFQNPSAWVATAVGVFGAVFILLYWHLALGLGIDNKNRAKPWMIFLILGRYALIALAIYAIIRLLGDRVSGHLGWTLLGFSCFLPGLLIAMWLNR